MPAGTSLAGWTADSKALLWYRRFASPIQVMKFDLASGRSDLWKEIPAPAGVGAVRITPDGKSYAFSVYSDDGDVYVLEPARSVMNMQSP